VKNPYPIARAKRIEMRRKQLGYASRCFYCPETELFCFEEDHPVTEGLDAKFKRVVCRNCHRKREASRDIQGLTKNGQHNVNETESEARQRHLLLAAEDLDTIAEHALTTPPELIAKALRESAASLRRKAQSVIIIPEPDARILEIDAPVAAQQSD